MRAWVFAAALLALQFLPGIGTRDAQASCTGSFTAPAVGTYNCSYRDEAYQKLVAYNAAYASQTNPPRTWTISYSVNGGTGKDQYQLTGLSQGYGAPAVAATFPEGTAQCPSGTTWNDTTKTCFSSAACLAKPVFGDQGTLNLSVSDKRCSGGCQFAYVGQRQSLTTRTGQAISVGYGGSFKPNGQPCASGDPASGSGDTSPPVQQCVPAGSGQTYCVKSNGEHCATASTGRQICWRPGETGEKTDGDTLQVRNAGDSPAPPATQPPPGETLSAHGDPITADTSVSGVTITTTTQNYQTQNGTNAGGAGADQGENADGTAGQSPGGQGDSGSGEGDGLNCDGCDNDDGSASHSGDSIWGADDTQSFEADEAGLGFGSTCPAPPTVLGHELDFSAFCTVMGYIGLLVLAAAHMHALYIILGD